MLFEHEDIFLQHISIFVPAHFTNAYLTPKLYQAAIQIKNFVKNISVEFSLFTGNAVSNREGVFQK